jgi:hypothetical protein
MEHQTNNLEFFKVQTKEIEKGFIFNKSLELKTFILMSEINDYELIDKLVLNAEKEIKKSTISGKTNVKAERTEFNSLTKDYNFHNFLKIIQPFIFKIYQKSFIVSDVWANIYSKENHYAEEHNHKGISAFCGILYCTDGPGPGTYFNEYDLNIHEKKGRFVLFTPELKHSVPQFNYTNKRITIAFNFNEYKKWENTYPYVIKNNNEKINI